MTGTNVDYYFVDPNQTYTSTFYDIGAFTFANAGTVPSLAGLAINITLNGLDTRTPGGDDYGHIDLTIDGIDTGVQMNGFGNANTTAAITGIVDPTAAAAIYSLFESGGYSYNLPTSSGTGNKVNDSGNPDIDPNTGYDSPSSAPGTTDAGQLVIGLVLTGDNPGANAYNTDSSPNLFRLAGGTATLQVSDQPIPFEPSQAMGFGLIALCIALWYVPATKELLKRILVPANV
jgi:hypothetical protein